MPSQFTPKDRETVRENTEELGYVVETGDCGNGLIAECRDYDETSARGLSKLTTEAGWHVDRIIKTPDLEYYILMPITEVPE